jgi:hypothetical protein
VCSQRSLCKQSVELCAARGRCANRVLSCVQTEHRAVCSQRSLCKQSVELCAARGHCANRLALACQTACLNMRAARCCKLENMFRFNVNCFGKWWGWGGDSTEVTVCVCQTAQCITHNDGNCSDLSRRTQT